jgi:peptide methionine sulfoxide reductase msrA/msrB
VDPFDDGGQFCDRGDSYRTGIFYHTDEQRRRAETSKREVAARFSQEIVTPIEPLDAFYRAEDYHQNYYKRSPIRYRFYRSACGRDARLEAVWGDEAGGYHLVGEARTGSRRGGPADEPTQTRSRTDGPRQEEVSRLVGDIEVDGKPYVVSAERYDPENRIIHDQRADIDYPVQLSERAWRRRLDSFEYRILRQAGTERAFSGDLYDNKRAGTYYSAASGQPVFHSEDKYTSGTGWPSFTKPISPDAVAYKWDRGIFSRRIEVVDSLSGSHLGHVFTDGPDPTGQRYCINSAALIFVPEGEKPPEMLGP